MTIGDKIKALRKDQGMSLRKLGELADYSFSSLCIIENGIDPHSGKVPQITIEPLVRICRVLDCDLALFLEETGYIPPRPADEVELVETYRSLDEDKKAIALDQIKSLL